MDAGGWEGVEGKSGKWKRGIEKGNLKQSVRDIYG